MYKVGDKVLFNRDEELAKGWHMTIGKIYEVIEVGNNSLGNYNNIIDDLGKKMTFVDDWLKLFENEIDYIQIAKDVCGK